MFKKPLKTLGGTFKTTIKANNYSRKLSNTGNYSNNWEILRNKRLELDSYKCQHCGFDGKNCKNKLHVHHIIPLADGGRNIITNLITLCLDCHRELHKKKNHHSLFKI